MGGKVRLARNRHRTCSRPRAATSRSKEETCFRDFMPCRLNMATVTMLALLSVAALSTALQAPTCNATQALTPSSLTCIVCTGNSIADSSGLLMFELGCDDSPALGLGCTCSPGYFISAGVPDDSGVPIACSICSSGTVPTFDQTACLPCGASASMNGAGTACTCPFDNYILGM